MSTTTSDQSAVQTALSRRVDELERYVRALERRLAELQADAVLREVAAAVAATDERSNDE